MLPHFGRRRAAPTAAEPDAPGAALGGHGSGSLREPPLDLASRRPPRELRAAGPRTLGLGRPAEGHTGGARLGSTVDVSLGDGSLDGALAFSQSRVHE
jgi:hypothetical protein